MTLEPTRRYGSWTGDQIETFLYETRAPMRLSVAMHAGPLIVPLWFQYTSGSFVSCSPQTSLLVKGLEREPNVAFDVSTNELPYRGVRGRGRATCAPTGDNAKLEALLERYLAGSENGLAKWLLSRDVAEALIEIEITWLTSWDFSGRMADIEKISARLPDAPI